MPAFCYSSNSYCYSDHIWQIFDAFFQIVWCWRYKKRCCFCHPSIPTVVDVEKGLATRRERVGSSCYHIPESEKHSHLWENHWGYQKQKIVLCISRAPKSTFPLFQLGEKYPWKVYWCCCCCCIEKYNRELLSVILWWCLKESFRDLYFWSFGGPLTEWLSNLFRNVICRVDYWLVSQWWSPSFLYSPLGSILLFKARQLMEMCFQEYVMRPKCRPI